MKQLHDKINEINDSNVETWQKIETIVHEIFCYLKKNKDIGKIKKIMDLRGLKSLYEQEVDTNIDRLAISNINKRLSMDETWLQNFRKTLDDNGVKVRVICKPQWTKYEPTWLKNREIKTLPNKYLLSSNIDILWDWKVIITNPLFQYLWIEVNDGFLHSLLKRLFYNLRNENQYIVWVTAWDSLSTESWINIMSSWKNYGIDYVINPALYPKIFDWIKQQSWQKIVDFWCGLNTLGMQLLYWIPSQIEWLKAIDSIENHRKNIEEYIWYESNETFVEQAIKHAWEFESEELKIIWKELIKNNQLQISDKSIDMCVSRNFIVHLNYEDFEYHLLEASRILKNWWKYILATLNPSYEHLKYHKLTWSWLIDWDRYNHYHWNDWELWTWVQYYKSTWNLEKCLKKQFVINSVEYCIPVNEDWKKNHPLYYDLSCPMGVIYSLTKK